MEVNAVREQILDVAFTILRKTGYEGLKMARIAARMHMTAANLYNYFTSKDELLIAIHKKASLMLYDAIKKAMETADTPLEKVKQMTYAFVAFGTENKHVYDIMFNRPVRQHLDYVGTPQEEMSYDEFIFSQNVLKFALGTLHSYLESRNDRHSLDLRTVANQSIMALHGIVSLSNSGALPYITLDFDKTLEMFVDEIMQSILWQPSA